MSHSEPTSTTTVESSSDKDNSLSSTASVSYDGPLRAADEASWDSFSDFNPVLGVLRSNAWSALVTIVIFISLYLQDANILLTDGDFDVYVTIAYYVMTFFFLMEILAFSILQRGYLQCCSRSALFSCGIFFWADFFSLLSMIPDLIPLETLGDIQEENSLSTLDVFLTSLKLLRLFRLWRLFKFLGLMSVYTDQVDGYAGTLGRSFSTYSSLKTGFMVIILCVVVSNLEYDSEYAGPPLVVALLENLEQFGASFNSTLDTFTDSYPVILIVQDSLILFADDEVDSFRSIEIEEFNGNRTQVYISVKEIVQADALYNILSISLIFVFFIVIVVMTTKQVDTQFVEIFKEFILRISKISKTVGIYQADDTLVTHPERFYVKMLDTLAHKVKN